MAKEVSFLYSLTFVGGESSGGVSWKHSQVLDVNGDGLADLAQKENGVLHVYTRNGAAPDLLLRVTDGLGAYETFGYEPLGSRRGFPAYIAPSTGCKYPLSCVKSGQWVVSYRIINNGEVTERAWSYRYGDGRMDRQTGDWLGFEWREIRDTAFGSTTMVTSDNQTRVGTVYPYARLPLVTVTGEQTELDRSVAVLRTKHRQVQYELVKPTSNSFFVYARDIDEREMEKKSGEPPILVRQTLYSKTEDNYGNITTAETQAYPIVAGQPNGIPTLNKLVTTYDNFAPSWLIGLARTIHTTSTTPDGRTATRALEHDYFPTTGLLWKTRVEPQTKNASEVGVSGFFRETTLSRNAYGLVDTIRVEASGKIRLDSLIYDPVDNAAVVEQHNSLGHVWSYEYHRGLGLPTLRRDPNNVELRTLYDGFGRARIITPQGSATTTIDYDNAPAGQYRIRVSVQGAGATEFLHDRRGREISRSWDGVNGRRAFIQKRYDPYGRLAGISVPNYEVRPGFPLIRSSFKTFEYDDMSRIKRIIHPDSTAITVSYDGTKTEHRDEKGNLRFFITDELGRITRSVQEDTGAHLVPTEIEYGPFGVLRKVIDPGGNVTAMEHDQLGRLSKVIDPNTGTAITLYDGFGDIKSTMDGANRTITTIRDDLGRPTTVNTNDGATTFTWDTAINGLGRLAASMSPDNIGTVHKYDSNGRF